jgi:hypothetical protein
MPSAESVTQKGVDRPVMGFWDYRGTRTVFDRVRLIKSQYTSVVGTGVPPVYMPAPARCAYLVSFAVEVYSWPVRRPRSNAGVARMCGAPRHHQRHAVSALPPCRDALGRFWRASPRISGTGQRLICLRAYLMRLVLVTHAGLRS